MTDPALDGEGTFSTIQAGKRSVLEECGRSCNRATPGDPSDGKIPLLPVNGYLSVPPYGHLEFNWFSYIQALSPEKSVSSKPGPS